MINKNPMELIQRQLQLIAKKRRDTFITKGLNLWEIDDPKNLRSLREVSYKLKEIGIDAILDIWDLKHGHDKNYFMEQIRKTDKVLIICDQQYKEKADSRSESVGRETQYIIEEVIRDVKQEKYLPVIKEKCKDKKMVLPLYLESRIYFDLSDEATFDEEYQKLVCAIRDIDYEKKPELGQIPFPIEKKHRELNPCSVNCGSGPGLLNLYSGKS